MAFWADCVKFVRSNVFSRELLTGRTPIKFKRIELTIPAGERSATYRIEDMTPSACIVSLSGGSDQSLQDQDTNVENVIVGYSHVQNSVYVLHREILDHPMYYRVDVMYVGYI